MQKQKALPQIVHHRSAHSKHLSQRSVFPASLIVTLIGVRPRGGGGGGGGGGTFLGGTGGGSRVAVGAGLMGQRPHERLQEAAMKRRLGLGLGLGLGIGLALTLTCRRRP